MKKLIISAIALTAAVLSGCKTLPSTDDMSKLGTAAGYTTAYVLNKQVKMTNVNTRVIIRDVVTKIDNYLPATNETCSAKWNPMVENLLDEYVASNKITRAQADLINNDFKAVTLMLDKYIDKKGIRAYQDLVDAFIHSFSNEFLANFKSNPSIVSAAIKALESEKFDTYVHDILASRIK